jgi:hypothetical protein
MGRSFEDAYEAEFIHAWAELSDSEIADAIGLRLTTATAGPGETIAPGGLWTVEHPDLNTVYGSVHPDAATVRLTFADGSTATVPVVEHLYLTSTARGAQAETVTAFDAAGNQVAQRTLGPDAATRG